MDKYFNYIVNGLSYDEVLLLGILKEADATAPFKSILRIDMYRESNLSLASFRKTVNSLLSVQFISVVVGDKKQRIYITDFGIKALNDFLKEA